MSYLDQRRKFIEDGRPLPEKKKKHYLPKISKKRKEKLSQQKQQLSGGKSELQSWFDDRQEELTGTCQCGCGRPSSKFDKKNFRSSICHILPQRLFPSVALHPLNFVERNFWEGCHANMDNRSMDLWPNMADWDDIAARVQILAGLLTEKERSKKFFGQIWGLVQNFPNSTKNTHSHTSTAETLQVP